MPKGGIISAQSQSVTAGAAWVDLNIPFFTTTILLRALSTNTDNIQIQLGAFDVLGGNIILRPNESLSIDITQILQLKVALGQKITMEDYINKLTYYGAASNPVMYIDVLGL